MTTDGTTMELPAGGPAIRRRRLAAELRQRREQAGLTLVQAAARLEWSSAKISRIENAQVSILPRDAKLLAGLYGVHGSDDRAQLIALARQTRQKPWWHHYGLTVPGWFQPYAALEADAASLRSYHPELVPALLQTPAYRNAVPALPGREDQEAAQFAALLTARQHRLATTGAPRLHAIVSEAVLRRPAGGPAIMAAQLTRLAQASQEPGVTIQVLPFAAGTHPAMDAPFALLTFPDPADPDIVSPGLHGAPCLDDVATVQRHQHVFTRLRQMALPAEASRGLISQAAAELTRRARP
jgi:transcriptional regulator with XRE-family HTH domain